MSKLIARTSREEMIQAAGTEFTKTKVELSVLEGVRGLCAFYVMMHHICLEMTPYRGSHSPFEFLITGMWWLFGWGGHDCVTVFICLSGLSLAIPFAKKAYAITDGRSEIKNYFVRRFLRIAPPYFAAILLVVFGALLVPSLSKDTGGNWGLSLPILDTNAIVSHLLFVHALIPSEVFKVSPQFWSIGTEFQLYAVLPAILLPIARQKSMAWSVLFSLLLCVPIISISSVATIDRACLHYIFTFSLGAFVADRLFSKQPLNLKVYVLPVCILFFLAIATAKVSLSLWAVRDLTLSPFIATALYLLVSNNFQSKAKSLVMTVLRSNLVLALGKRSYSLYLCHFLAIGLVHTILISMGASVSQKLVALVIVAPCLGLGISFAMFALVEAPSLKWIKNFRTTPSESNENERQTALAA